MNFNSYEFLLFLPLVFALYWLLRGKKRQNLWIVAASLFFYGWWDWRFLGLMLVTAGCSYGAGLAVGYLRDTGKRGAKGVVAASAAVNLAILALFKYFDFFTETLRQLLAGLGFLLDPVTLSLVLPVGISFYTFQALGYVIDVYRGQVQLARDPVAFTAFICFFPQLVAGPIERASNLLPQFQRPRSFSYPEGVEGCRRILWGLLKKVVIADNCAPFVGQVFANAEHANVQSLAIAAILFSFQIYCDFSGYSDIAIGTARLFGIRLNANFATPYFSRTIPEFWTRWHISLSTWFRDYVYIPLGGNRRGKARQGGNILAVFLLSGLWHGAAMTFVAWGGIHALYQLPALLRKKRRKLPGIAGGDRRLPNWQELWRICFTFFLVVLAWIPFRAATLREAGVFIARMFTSFDFAGSFIGWPMIPVCLLLVAVEWTTRHRECPLFFSPDGIFRHRAARWCVYYAMVILLLLYPGVDGSFLYFQF